MRSSRSLIGPLAALVFAGCPQPPPSPKCQRDSDCPAGEACLEGSCRSLTQVLQNLSAVVVPSDPTLAPAEVRAVDATAPYVDFFLPAPQLLRGAFALPSTCSPGELLPIRLRFTGHPFIPLLDWTFFFVSDGAGRLVAALPSGESFDEWAEPALPCAAPIAATDRAQPGLVDPATAFAFPTGADALTVLGNVSAPGAAAPLAGATVTVKSATGAPLSATVVTPAGAVLGFALPVPLAQTLAQPGGDGGSCALPDPGSCDGGSCEILGACASIVLEVGPSAEQPLLPTVDLPIVARMAPSPDGGGPTLALLGQDGLGVRLPFAPGGSTVAGEVVDPTTQAALPGAEVTLDGQAMGGGVCGSGCPFHLTGIADAAGEFSLAAPIGSYTLGVVPPPGSGLAPSSVPITVPLQGPGILLSAAPGISLSGRALDPASGSPLGGGEVELTDLSDGALVGAAPIGALAPGQFQLTVPPGKYLVEIHPPDATGLPERSLAVAASTDTNLGDIPLYPGARLEGSVFAEPLDGGAPLPARFASLRFFFLEETEALGATVALPIAAGLTDGEGHFSLAVPSASAAQ